VVTPGLSTMKSLAWRMTSTAMAARWQGMAAQTMRWIDGSSNNRSGSATRGMDPKRSWKPFRVKGSPWVKYPAHSSPMACRLDTWS